MSTISMDEGVFVVADWSEERVDENKTVVELEGKTKLLATSVAVLDQDGAHLVALIPEFQGAWMRVRITVENITPRKP